MKQKRNFDINFIIDNISDIDFFNLSQSIIYKPIAEKWFKKKAGQLSDDEHYQYQIFYYKLIYYANEMDENVENDLLSFLRSSDKKIKSIPSFKIAGYLILIRRYLTTNRLNLIHPILELIKPWINETIIESVQIEAQYIKTLYFLYLGQYEQAAALADEQLLMPPNTSNKSIIHLYIYFRILLASIYMNLGMYRDSLSYAIKGYKEYKKHHPSGAVTTTFFLSVNCISLNLFYLSKYEIASSFIHKNMKIFLAQKDKMYLRFNQSILNKISIDKKEFDKIQPIEKLKSSEKLSPFALLEYQVENLYFQFMRKKSLKNLKLMMALEEEVLKTALNSRLSYYRFLLEMTGLLDKFKLYHHYSKLLKEVEERVNSDKAKNQAIGYKIKYDMIHLRERMKQAEDKAKIKHDFLVGFSHDIRSPLAMISNASKLLDKEGTDEKKTKEYVRSIRYSSQELIELIDEMIDVSKIESNQIVIHTREIPVQIFLESIIEFHHLAAVEKGLKLEIVNQSPNTDFIETDVQILRRILNNLIQNAIKYTSKGKISLIFSQNHTEYLFKVIDTGMGIELENQDEIFQLYNRTQDRDNARTKESHGIGLYLVKNLSEALGGKIKLESQIGKGSSFQLSIPIQEINASSIF